MKSPIFEYDDRYFTDSSYSKEQLFAIQQAILDIEKSDDLIQDINKLGIYDINAIKETVEIAVKFHKIGHEKFIQLSDNSTEVKYCKH